MTKRYKNLEGLSHRGFVDALRWMMTRRPPKWECVAEPFIGEPPMERVPPDTLRATVVGHSTVLIQFAGRNILTDPIWSNTCGPIPGIGPKRVCPPAIRFKDLPPMNVVLLSHNHYDHLDAPTMRGLYQRHRPRFIVPPGNARTLASLGIEGITEIGWWESVGIFEGFEIHSVPAQHWSGRGLFDRTKSHWAGYVLRAGEHTVYFAGDTGWGPHFAMIRERFGAPTLALIPIGAYLPRWFMHPVHISPEEAVRVHQVLEAGHSIPIHYGTFRLADDAQTQALDELENALGQGDEHISNFHPASFGMPFETKLIPKMTDPV